MGYTSLKIDEQKFLRSELENRLAWNTGQSLKVITTLSAFDPLFEDMCKVLGIPNDVILVDEKTKRVSNFLIHISSSKKEVAFSHRSLRDFFDQEKTKMDDQTLEAYYAYISNVKLSREAFLRQNPSFFIPISKEEHYHLQEKVWRKIKEDYQGDATADMQKISQLSYIINHIRENIDKSQLFVNIDSEAIDPIFKMYKDDVSISITSINALYYFISDGQYNRDQYREAHPKSITEQLDDDRTIHGENNPASYLESPEIALGMLSLSVVGLLYFLSMWYYMELTPNIILTIALLVVVFVSSVLWFILLRSQVKRKSAKFQSDFWLWWFGKLPVREVLHKGPKVKVIVIHDDSFLVQHPLQVIANDYKIVSILQINCRELEPNELKKVLSKCKADGLYFFLTPGLEKLDVLKIILDWSKKFDDVPIVYVDYIDKKLDYGRILPEDASFGLWQLLSQALKRTGAWRNQAKAYRKYSQLANKFLFFLCGVFAILTLIRSCEVDNVRTQMMEIEKELIKCDEKSLFVAEQYLLRAKNLLNVGKSQKGLINVSMFIYNAEDSIIKQIRRTDYRGLVGFEAKMKEGVVPLANNEKVTGGAVFLRDTNAFWKIDPIHYSKKVDTEFTEPYYFAKDKDADRQRLVEGILCVKKKVGNTSFIGCVEVEGDEDLAKDLLQAKMPETFDVLMQTCNDFHTLNRKLKFKPNIEEMVIYRESKKGQ